MPLPACKLVLQYVYIDQLITVLRHRSTDASPVRKLVSLTSPERKEYEGLQLQQWREQEAFDAKLSALEAERDALKRTTVALGKSAYKLSDWDADVCVCTSIYRDALTRANIALHKYVDRYVLEYIQVFVCSRERLTAPCSN